MKTYDSNGNSTPMTFVSGDRGATEFVFESPSIYKKKSCMYTMTVILIVLLLCTLIFLVWKYSTSKKSKSDFGLTF